MRLEWWLFFGLGGLLGYQMKVISTRNITNKISAVDSGLMLGSVAFFLHHIMTADHSLYDPHD